MATTSFYAVISPLKHNGKRYVVSDTVELVDEAAQPLLANKVISGPVAKPAKKAADKD